MLPKYWEIPWFNGPAPAFLVHSYMQSVAQLSEGVNAQSDREFLMDFYMKQLTVEEENGGIVVSRRAQIAVYPVLEWFDDLGVYHDLTLLGSDVNWLTEMNVSVEELGKGDRPKRRLSLRARRE